MSTPEPDYSVQNGNIRASYTVEEYSTVFQADANAILPIAWMDAVVNFTERRVYNICFDIQAALKAVCSTK